MISSPVLPEVGEKEVIVGGGIKINPVFDTLPAGCVTTIVPLAPAPTVAVSVVPEPFTEILVAGTPPKVTCVAPVKLVPESVTVAPGAAATGLNEVKVGGR